MTYFTGENLRIKQPKLGRYSRVSAAPGYPGNTGNLLEFDIPPGNTGNLLEFNWSSWKIFMTRRRNFLYQVGLIAG